MIGPGSDKNRRCASLSSPDWRHSDGIGSLVDCSLWSCDSSIGPNSIVTIWSCDSSIVPNSTVTLWSCDSSIGPNSIVTLWSCYSILVLLLAIATLWSHGSCLFPKLVLLTSRYWAGPIGLWDLNSMKICEISSLLMYLYWIGSQIQSRETYHW